MTIAEKYSPEFANAVKITLEKEGVFANDKADAGGETKYGISQRFLDGIKYPKKARDITKDEAIELYYIHFWRRCNGDRLHPGIALFIFDYAVNSGVGTACKALQRVINYEPSNDIAEDGVIGEKTLTKMNALVKKPSGYPAVIQALSTVRGKLFIGIIEKRPDQGVFFRGWLRRLWEITEIAQSLNK